MDSIKQAVNMGREELNSKLANISVSQEEEAPQQRNVSILEIARSRLPQESQNNYRDVSSAFWSSDDEREVSYTKKRQKWTQNQVDCLEEGLRRYKTKWAKILDDFGDFGLENNTLAGFSRSQLKDKARNEKLRRIREQEDVGVWIDATG